MGVGVGGFGLGGHVLLAQCDSPLLDVSDFKCTFFADVCTFRSGQKALLNFSTQKVLTVAAQHPRGHLEGRLFLFCRFISVQYFYVLFFLFYFLNKIGSKLTFI